MKDTHPQVPHFQLSLGQYTLQKNPKAETISECILFAVLIIIGGPTTGVQSSNILLLPHGPPIRCP